MRKPLIPLLLLGLAALGSTARADDTAAEPRFSSGWQFEQHSGAAIYGALCAACHMPDGRGAQGAGAYPALQGNPRLASGAYVLHMVVNGRRAMPALGRQLSDAQIAAVASYVRERFGGLPAGEAALTAADAAASRPAPAPADTSVAH